MNVSWCRSRWLYEGPHKSEQCPLCPTCASWWVCGGGAIVMRQQGTPSQMARFIPPNPNPETVFPYPFISHASMWPCVYVHTRLLHTRMQVVVNSCVCMCVWTCVWVYVCVCVCIFVSLTKSVCLDVCVFVAKGTCMQVCMCACTLNFLENKHGENCGPLLVCKG